VCIACGHGYRPVTGQHLYFFDRGSGQCQPRAESVPVGVPCVVDDFGFFQCRFKPPAAIGAWTGPGEYHVTGLVGITRLLLHRIESYGIKGNISRRSVLCLGEPDNLPLKVNLRPTKAELFAPPHPGIHAHDKRGHLFRVVSADDVQKRVVLPPSEVPNPRVVLRAHPHQTSRVDLNFAVGADSFCSGTKVDLPHCSRSAVPSNIGHKSSISPWRLATSNQSGICLIRACPLVRLRPRLGMCYLERQASDWLPALL
jgi:hypothetical protein